MPKAHYKDQKRLGYLKTSKVLTGWKKEEGLEFLKIRFFRTSSAILEMFTNRIY